MAGKTISGSLLLKGGAKLNASADFSLRVGTFGIGNAFLDWLRSFQTGSWLPGKLTVDADGLRFQPNPVDAALIENADPINLKADEIRSIGVRPYAYGGIVEFRTGGKVVTFWCWRARQAATEAASLLSAKLD